MAFVRPNLNEVVAELPGVQARVRAVAEATERRIKANIAPHSKTWTLFRSVKAERAFKGKDYRVVIEARYAVPVNFGFWHVRAQRRIDGINFLKGVVYG